MKSAFRRERRPYRVRGPETTAAAFAGPALHDGDGAGEGRRDGPWQAKGQSAGVRTRLSSTREHRLAPTATPASTVPTANCSNSTPATA